MAIVEAAFNNLLSGAMSGDFAGTAGIYALTGEGDLYKVREANPYWYDDPDNPGMKIVTNPYDPTGGIESYIARLEILEGIVDGLDESTDWNAFIATATTVADSIFDADDIQDVVTAFGNRQQLELNQAMNRVTGGFVDIDAVNGSAHVMALTLLALAHKQDMANFEADLTFNLEKEKRAAIYNGAEMLRALKDKGLDMQQITTHLRTELERLKIVAMGEYYDESMRRARNATQWNLEQNQYLANIAGGVAGSSLHPGRGDEVNTTKSTIGGALVGAQMGGAAGGYIGMGVGALIGGHFGRKAAD